MDPITSLIKKLGINMPSAPEVSPEQQALADELARPLRHSSPASPQSLKKRLSKVDFRY